MSKDKIDRGHWKPNFDDTLEDLFGDKVPEKFDYYEAQKVYDFIKKKYQHLLKLHSATTDLIRNHDDRYERMRQKMAPLEELVGHAKNEIQAANDERDEAVSKRDEVLEENVKLNDAVEGITRLVAQDHNRFADFNDKVSKVEDRLKKIQDQKAD